MKMVVILVSAKRFGYPLLCKSERARPSES